MMRRLIILPDHFILGLVIIKKRLMMKKALITLMLCRGDIGRTSFVLYPLRSLPLPIEYLLTQSIDLFYARRGDTSVEANVSFFFVCVRQEGFSCGTVSWLDNLSLILPAISFVTLQMIR